MKLLKLFWLLPILAGAACSTGPVDPRQANTLEILSGKGVEDYLANRREELARIRRQVTDLEDAIIFKLGQLHGLEKQLQSVATPSAESARERDELQKLLDEHQKALEASNLKVAQAKAEENRLRTEVAENRTRDEAQLAALRSDVSRLESENVVRVQAIDRSLTLRVEQLLTEESGP